MSYRWVHAPGECYSLHSSLRSAVAEQPAVARDSPYDVSYPITLILEDCETQSNQQPTTTYRNVYVFVYFLFVAAMRASSSIVLVKRSLAGKPP